jgi:uncharacterized membrane protein
VHDTPVTILVATFAAERSVERALAQRKRSKNKRLVGIRDAAAITRDAKDHLHLAERGDRRGGKGARIGAVVGGTIGLIFPRPCWRAPRSARPLGGSAPR